MDMLPEDNKRQKLLKGPEGYDLYHLLADSGFHYQDMRNMLQLNAGLHDSFPAFSEIGPACRYFQYRLELGAAAMRFEQRRLERPLCDQWVFARFYQHGLSEIHLSGRSYKSTSRGPASKQLGTGTKAAFHQGE
jgi:hypothetical protein